MTMLGFALRCLLEGGLLLILLGYLRHSISGVSTDADMHCVCTTPPGACGLLLRAQVLLQGRLYPPTS